MFGLGKKQVEVEDVGGLPGQKELAEEMAQESDGGKEDDDTPPMPQMAAPSAVDPRMIADIEKLKAGAEAQSEMRKITSERFLNVTEQIGELRNMMFERDRKMEKLEAQALRAIDLVDAVQPEKLMVATKKTDAKVEALNSKLDAIKEVNSSIISELKEIRNKMSLFRGVEDILKLEKDVKDELRNIQRIQAIMKGHADKVASIFTEVEKKFAEFEQFKDMAESLEKDFRSTITEINEMKTKLEDVYSKEKAIVGEERKLEKEYEDLEKGEELIKEKMEAYPKVFSMLEGARKALTSGKIGDAKKIYNDLKAMYPSLQIPSEDKKRIYYGILELKTDIELGDMN